MFHYEYEKRPASSNSCESRTTMTTEWSRSYPSSRSIEPRPAHLACPRPNSARPSSNLGCSSPNTACSRPSERVYSIERARRPLPPRPVCEIRNISTKSSVPLKVWVLCVVRCACVLVALSLAAVLVFKWGFSSPSEPRVAPPEQIYTIPSPQFEIPKTTTTKTEIIISEKEIIDNDIELPILEKLSIFKNIVGNRDKVKKNDNKKTDLGLIGKPQMHPIHDTSLYHVERKIEKKDKAQYPDNIEEKSLIPDFKPTLPDVFINKHNDIKLSDGYLAGLRKYDTDYYEDYYNDENFYEDYIQSNSMTSYLIEKVQELHDWIVKDPDFEAVKNSSRHANGNNFGQLLKALNESIIEGNVTLVMNKLREMYFGTNHTHTNRTRKVILTNSTDLLSFGILTLDVMLLHNIQLMAWESQEAARNKMLKDPDVFAFNALFLDPTKVEAKQNEVYHHDNSYSKRQNHRKENIEDFDIGKNLLENVLEIGMSTARAAIHLGRAYKNTRNVLNQLSNQKPVPTNIQNQISRNIDGNTHALNHLQTSFKNESLNANSTFYTELDCVWLLYCKNLAATAKLNAPYGTMARINGMALRMLAGELPAEKALDTMMYEALTGWTDLNCTHMFPRCSKVNAANIVLDSILQPTRKSSGRSS